MIEIIRPHGGISERLVYKVYREPNNRFGVIDIDGNRYGVTEETFNSLKERGVTEYEIK